jgi:hypothetical protein
MTNSQLRLSIHKLDALTVQLEATPLDLLSFIGELLSLAEGDPGPDHGYDDLKLPGVQLDEDSEALLVCRVSDARLYARNNDPRSPVKLEPMQIVPGNTGLQLNASKDGLIRLSGELITILMSKASMSQLAAGKELGEGSMSVTLLVKPDDSL